MVWWCFIISITNSLVGSHPWLDSRGANVRWEERVCICRPSFCPQSPLFWLCASHGQCIPVHYSHCMEFMYVGVWILRSPPEHIHKPQSCSFRSLILSVASLPCVSWTSTMCIVDVATGADHLIAFVLGYIVIGAVVMHICKSSHESCYISCVQRPSILLSAGNFQNAFLSSAFILSYSLACTRLCSLVGICFLLSLRLMDFWYSPGQGMIIGVWGVWGEATALLLHIEECWERTYLWDYDTLFLTSPGYRPLVRVTTAAFVTQRLGLLPVLLLASLLQVLSSFF